MMACAALLSNNLFSKIYENLSGARAPFSRVFTSTRHEDPFNLRRNGQAPVLYRLTSNARRPARNLSRKLLSGRFRPPLAEHLNSLPIN